MQLTSFSSLYKNPMKHPGLIACSGAQVSGLCKLERLVCLARGSGCRQRWPQSIWLHATWCSMQSHIVGMQQIAHSTAGQTRQVTVRQPSHQIRVLVPHACANKQNSAAVHHGRLRRRIEPPKAGPGLLQTQSEGNAHHDANAAPLDALNNGCLDTLLPLLFSRISAHAYR